MNRWWLALWASCALMPVAAQAQVPAGFGAPIALGDGLSLDPLADLRVRWEDQSQPAKALSADAVTMRLRGGVELRHAPSHLALLLEGQILLAPVERYNAFGYANTRSSQYRPQYATVSDPQNVALSRAQLQYRDRHLALTLGRQLITLDDQRWIGGAQWRQSEQTFDAVRAVGNWGPITIDATRAKTMRSINGTDGGPRVAFDGRFTMLNAAIAARQVVLKGFAYLLDVDPASYANQSGARAQLDSSQTWGARATTKLPLGHKATLALAASYARQSSYGANPRHYAAPYLAGEAAFSAHGITLTAGYEDLGADARATGGPWSVQTPMAALHLFDGWADQFLTTPARGLQDRYAGLAYAFPAKIGIPSLNARVLYHRFNSDIGNITYGHEWDAATGWRTGRVSWLVKYAGYAAQAPASAGAGTTTRKFWLMGETQF